MSQPDDHASLLAELVALSGNSPFVAEAGAKADVATLKHEIAELKAVNAAIRRRGRLGAEWAEPSGIDLVGG